jgi:hypothetical protein
VKVIRLVRVANAAMLLTSAAFPLDNVVVRLFVTAAKQSGPVEVVGFKYPEKALYPDAYKSLNQDFCVTAEYCPKVVFHNRTEKDVTAIEAAALLGNPEKMQDVEPASQLGLISVNRSKLSSHYVIAAKSQADFGSLALWPDVTAGMGEQKLQSVCIHAAAVVTRVEFSDGTVWTIDPTQTSALWRESIPSGTASSCQTTREAVTAIASLNGRWPDLLPNRPSDEIVDSYSAICPVKQIGKGVTALVCAW